MARPKTEYVNLGDARIAYTQAGSGVPLILLHGNSASKKMFKRYQVEYFTEYRTLAIDSRGHGESISMDAAYSIDQYSDDVIKVCGALGISEAFVIGYSDGGNIALLLAKKAPDIFRKIAAISPNYLASGLKDTMLAMFTSISKFLVFLGRLGLKTQKQVKRFDLILNDIGISDDELGSIRTSMKILYAENDLIKEEHIKRIAELIPRAELAKIGRCSHLTIFNKRETIEAIKAYLRG
jgi:pimeloyl-ACP methyl ester carboxylesterase